MRIISQNETVDIDYKSSILNLQNENDFFIIYCQDKNVNHAVGAYKTKTKAIAVMEEIRDHYTEYSWARYPSNDYYYMPQEVEK